MTRQAQLPDGTVLEFPDETPDDVIDAVVKKHIVPKRSPQELQNAAMQGDKAAAAEFAARMKATTGQDYKPVSAANPNAFTGFDSNMMAAAGSTLGDTGNGIMQSAIEGGTVGNMVRAGLGAVGINAPKSPMQDWIQKRITEKRALDAPMLDAPGGTSGAILGNMLQIATPGAVAKAGAIKAPGLVNVSKALNPTTYRGNALFGAVMGSLQPRTEGESQALNTLGGTAGGIAGQWGANRVSGLLRGGGNKLSEMKMDLYNKAKALDIPVTAAQLSDSRTIKWLQSMTKDIPFTGAASINKKQVDSLTRATAGLFGEKTDALTPKALEGIKGKISGMYDNVFKDTKVKLDKKAFQQYSDLVAEGPSTLEPHQRDMLAAWTDRVKSSMRNGELDGPLYQNLRLQMKELENGTAYGNAVKKFRKILEGAAERSAPPEKAGLLREADAMYRDKKLVDKLMTGADTMDVKTATEGKVNPARIWGLEHGKYGASPRVDDLGRIGQMLKDTAPSSGTSQRTFFGGMVADAGKIAKAAVAIPAGRVLNSPTLGKYVAEGIGPVLKDPVATGLLNATRPFSRVATQSASIAALPALQNTQSRSSAIVQAAMEQPDRGPEILSNLPPQEQIAAATEFAKANGLDVQAVLQKMQSEGMRVKQVLAR